MVSSLFPSKLAPLAAALMAVFAVGSARAEIYKWVDEGGTIHFSDDPSAAPKRRGDENSLFFVPPRAPAAAVPDSAPEPARLSDPVSPPPGDKHAVVAKIKRRGEGFVVEALINGAVRADLLIDTGSSFTILTPETARRLGHTGFGKLPRLPVSTAAGVSWVRLVTLDSVSVGGAEAEIVEGGISSRLEKGIDGLLGMSFLKEFVYRIDGAKREITLRPARGAGKTYGGHDRGWWLTKYKHYAHNIRRFRELREKLAGGVTPAQDPEMRKVSGFDEEEITKIIVYYQKLLGALDRRASSLGTPMAWRVYP